MMANRLPILDDLDFEGKIVLCRVDFNVPLKGGVVTDDTRITAFLPTLKHIRDTGARVVLCSHLGRPKGKRDPSLSLLPAAAKLATLIDAEVIFAHDTVGDEVAALARELPDGGVMVVENLRFDSREKAGDDEFARDLAALADVFVCDAFGAMHREHASITGVCEHLPSAAGLLVEKEIEALSKLTGRVDHPFAAVLGGAKVADKTSVVEALAKRVDHIFIGGAMANTFLHARGVSVGASRISSASVDAALDALDACDAAGVEVHLPVDFVVADRFAEDAEPKPVVDIDPDDMALDIGPETVANWSEVLADCRTVFWNGPMGVFEFETFASGTFSIANTLAECTTSNGAVSIVGGGDSVAAINQSGKSADISHISTGGGASLKLLEGKDLPGVVALNDVV